MRYYELQELIIGLYDDPYAQADYVINYNGLKLDYKAYNALNKLENKIGTEHIVALMEFVDALATAQSLTDKRDCITQN